VHAKEMGTQTTACGQPTSAWAKLWDVKFDEASEQTRCVECYEAVRRSGLSDPGHLVLKRIVADGDSCLADRG